MEKRWEIAPPMPPAAAAHFNGHPPLLAQLLYNRGVREPAEVQDFLAEEVALGDPFALSGMAQAVDRIGRAIQDGDKIAVYGDFDVDGVTATALLSETLVALGANFTAHIPHRIDDGYGLNVESLRKLKDQGVKIVVTVDCGMRSWNEAEAAAAMGLELIVTDHHSPGGRPMECLAIVNPKLENDTYPFKELSGAGVAFKLAQALLQRLPHAKPISEESLIELVALGTVADLVPLKGENRILVKRGLKELAQTHRPGLRALSSQSGRTPRFDAAAIGHFYGPRLNAAGRIEHALTAFRLLTTKNPQVAVELAGKLDSTNRERQRLTQDLTQRARESVADSAEQEPILIVADADYPEGIVGLIAGRLQEEYYRPALAIHLDGSGVHRGSARSVPEFNIVNALDECRDLLCGHGGHSTAAGFRVSTENLPKFKARMREIAARELAWRVVQPTLNIDAEAALTQMNWDLAKLVESLAPFGFGNREPVFLSRGVLMTEARIVGNGHLRFYLREDNGRYTTWDGIAFRQGDLLARLEPFPRRVDIAYSLQTSSYQGQMRLQIEARDLRAAE